MDNNFSPYSSSYSKPCVTCLVLKMVYNRTDSRKCPAIKEIAEKKLAKIQALMVLEPVPFR